VDADSYMSVWMVLIPCPCGGHLPVVRVDAACSIVRVTVHSYLVRVAVSYYLIRVDARYYLVRGDAACPCRVAMCWLPCGHVLFAVWPCCLPCGHVLFAVWSFAIRPCGHVIFASVGT
jgi:hypothetical protein